MTVRARRQAKPIGSRGKKKKDAYTQAGVNVTLGDRFSAIAGGICKQSFRYCPRLDIDDGRADGRFRGPVGFRLKGLPSDTYYTAGADGIGTKVMLYLILKKYGFKNAARDLIAMILDDIVRYGSLPLAIGNVLDVSTLGEDENDPVFKAFIEIIQGLGNVLREQEVSIVAGELAELGPFVGSEDRDARVKFNWAGFAIGAMRRRMRIIGDKIRPGQPIIALREPGLRSNGFSAFRKLMRELFGPEWWKVKEAMPMIEEAGQASVIYARLISWANGWFNPDFEPNAVMTGIAHITGGGITGKFGDDLLGLTGHSAELTSLYEPPAVVRTMTEHFKMKKLVPYSKFCCGQGMLVVLESDDDAETFVSRATMDGFDAQLAGRILKTRKSSKPFLRIKSAFDSRAHLHFTKST